MIIEALVSGGVRLLALRAVAEKPQRRQRPDYRFPARNKTSFDSDWIRGEAESGCRDAAMRIWAGIIANQTIFEIGLIEEIPEGIALELLDKVVAA